MDLRKITENVTVAPQIECDDLQAIAKLGFKSVICNRPDDEELTQTNAHDIEQATLDAGLSFTHQPIIGGKISMQDVYEFGELMSTLELPVLAYCRSGTRCSTLWALSEASVRDADEIIDLCADAGYDYQNMRKSLVAIKNQSS